ncbi:hypothetical protein [Limosilactobacillus reuteri]|uniref:hypothetical protein n=1 Tax=Limosilactobacillus reuteri TaxID=1598 RepID=UPI001E3D3550|nr:hypothetical protein [Limosilactobacillus reuteri]MCC4466436.1 hypothetical protein [Limosilactobacillus reuteri]MCC4474212.1 hypothetical protein [Limosilactobacillus reuteri]
MVSKLSNEFYDHLHSIEERCSYLKRTDSLSDVSWTTVISDTDEDLVFCREYIKKAFGEETEEARLKQFVKAFYEIVPNKITSIPELADYVECSPTQIATYLKKTNLNIKYHAYQQFLRSTVVHNENSERSYIALSTKDILELCHFPKKLRTTVSKAKSNGKLVGNYSFVYTIDYLQTHKDLDIDVEDLYEKKIVRIA